MPPPSSVPSGPVAAGDATATPVRGRRLELLDGLRGIAILLVVLSHGWVLWPIEWIDEHEWVRLPFRSGNFAVTIFFVVTGYLTYRSLSAHGLVNMRVGVGIVRRVLRVAPATLVVLPVVILASLFSDDPTSREANWQTFVHVSTYTWNWHVQTDAINARWDLGHLWYLSVDMQAFVAMSILLYFTRRRPLAQVASLVGLLLLLTWWRMHVTELEPVLNVLLRTTARMDPFVVGVLLGVLLTFVRPGSVSPRATAWTGIGAAVALGPLLWFCSRDDRFLGWGVTLLEIDLALLVAAVALGGSGLGVLRAPGLRFLGRHSLPLYVWHYPVFAAVETHTGDWAWPPRTLLALAITAVACVASHLLIERRVARLLVHPFWARLRPQQGVSPGADPRREDLRIDDLSLPSGKA